MMPQEKTLLPGDQALRNRVKRSDVNVTTPTGESKFNLDFGNHVDHFKQTISKAGMTPPKTITPGQMERFSGTGQKDKNAWAVFFLNPDGSAAGTYGDWKAGLSKNWFSSGNQTLSTHQRQEFDRMLREAKEKYESELKKKHRAAAIEAGKIWDNATPAPPDRPYLIKKGVKPYGIRYQGTALIAPVMDAGGAICSLQRILPDGQKRFLPGGKMQGGRFIVGDPAGAGILYICEGYATGASIHEATGKPVVVAFNAGNLEAVARHIRKLYPNHKIIISGDNDLHTEGNPGKTKAEAAAAAIGSGVVLPPLDGDFNDLHQSEGLEAVRHALSKTQSIEHVSTATCTPLPLIRESQRAEPYPLDALGRILGPAAKAMNEIIQAPDAVCAHSLLGFAAHTIQGHANLTVDGRIYSLNEFFLSICDRSGRKSECDIIAGRHHKRLQREMFKAYKTELATYRDEQKAYETAKKVILDNKKISLAEKNEKLADLREIEPWAPYEPLLRFSDPTVEGIHKMFERGTPSKFLCADEGGQFSGGHSMKSENKIYSATTYSKYWDGAPIDRVRGGDGSSVLYGRRLSVHLMMQSGVALKFYNDQELADQGLRSRLLTVFPESLVGGRHYKEVDVTQTSEMKNFYAKAAHNLDSEPPLSIDDRTGQALNELEPRIIHLTNRAKRMWIMAYEEIEAESGKGRTFETIGGFAGKAAAHILRLAGILSMFEDFKRNDVPEQYISQAVILMQFYLNERLRVTEIAVPEIKLVNAQSLLTWIQKRNFKTITLPDVYQFGPSTFRDKTQASESIKILEDHLWLSAIKDGGMSELKQEKSRKAWRVYHEKI